MSFVLLWVLQAVWPRLSFWSHRQLAAPWPAFQAEAAVGTSAALELWSFFVHMTEAEGGGSEKTRPLHGHTALWSLNKSF